MVGLKSYSQCAVAPYAWCFGEPMQGRTDKVRLHMLAFRCRFSFLSAMFLASLLNSWQPKQAASELIWPMRSTCGLGEVPWRPRPKPYAR
jgi:hypothetical protein